MKSLVLASALAISATAAAAENEISLYTGYQWAPHSVVTGAYDGEGFDFTAGWDGRPFAMPPYWGLRVTRWNEAWGVAVDFSHSKVYADDATLAANNLDVLEMTDGVNTLTANLMYRLRLDSALTPYAGVGVGFAVPHFEFQPEGGELTFEYQFAGLVAQAEIGVAYAFDDHWSAFGEYKLDYAMISADVQPAGYFDTDLVINAVNFGVSYGW